MNKLCPEGRIPHSGDRQVSEHTNSEYVSETISRLKRDYLACPEEWRETFLAGLPTKDREALVEILNQK